MQPPQCQLSELNLSVLGTGPGQKEPLGLKAGKGMGGGEGTRTGDSNIDNTKLASQYQKVRARTEQPQSCREVPTL